MREPREWDEDYLFSLPVGEFDWLEVKGRRGIDLSLSGVQEHDVRENLSRAVSAFANSGGGVIVLGMANPGNNWQVDDGGVELAMKKPNTREWLEDVIPQLVDLPLRSFNVYVIRGTVTDSQIASGRGIFVIEIRDSEQAPHQASDNKYYARVGGKSRPIGHRLVTDIFGRRKDPKIELHFKIKASTHFDQYNTLIGSPKKKLKIELVVQARNIGRVYAQYVNCFVTVPASLISGVDLVLYKDKIKVIGDVEYVKLNHTNTHRDVTKFDLYGPAQYGPSWFMPVLPNLADQWSWELREDLTQNDLLSTEQILWEVFADNAPKNAGSIMLQEIRFSSTEE